MAALSASNASRVRQKLVLSRRRIAAGFFFFAFWFRLGMRHPDAASLQLTLIYCAEPLHLIGPAA